MIKSLCIITDIYPSQYNPAYTFVGELVRAISRKGVKCTVICGGSNKKDSFWSDYDADGNEIKVYQAFIPSFGLKRIGPNALTYYYRDWKFKQLYRLSGCKPDALYAHFWHTGIAAAKIAETRNLPVFVAAGESRILVQELYQKEVVDQYKQFVQGMISVSSENLDDSVNLGLIDRDHTIVVPNAIDNKLFRKLNKEECRNKLGIAASDFVVAFVGAFVDRKGPLRVAQAVGRVSDVKSIYIGKGDQQPQGDGILFCGQLPHNEIPVYLNAADAFVLPTKQEGCCNAIVEAMACGLPIISTDRRFNDDILNENNSIRIDCEDIDQIAEAIRKIKESTELRESMSKESLRIAADLTIDKRAGKIIDFMEQSMRLWGK